MGVALSNHPNFTSSTGDECLIPIPILSEVKHEMEGAFYAFQENSPCPDALCTFFRRKHYHCTQPRCFYVNDAYEDLRKHSKDFHETIEILDGFAFFEKNVDCRLPSCRLNKSNRHFHCKLFPSLRSFVKVTTKNGPQVPELVAISVSRNIHWWPHMKININRLQTSSTGGKVGVASVLMYQARVLQLLMTTCPKVPALAEAWTCMDDPKLKLQGHSIRCQDWVNILMNPNVVKRLVLHACNNSKNDSGLGLEFSAHQQRHEKQCCRTLFEISRTRCSTLRSLSDDQQHVPTGRRSSSAVRAWFWVRQTLLQTEETWPLSLYCLQSGVLEFQSSQTSRIETCGPEEPESHLPTWEDPQSGNHSSQWNRRWQNTEQTTWNDDSGLFESIFDGKQLSGDVQQLAERNSSSGRRPKFRTFHYECFSEFSLPIFSRAESTYISTPQFFHVTSFYQQLPPVIAWGMFTLITNWECSNEVCLDKTGRN